MNIKYFLLLFSFHSCIQAQFVTLFSHGIADTYKQAYQYTKIVTNNAVLRNNPQYLMTNPVISFNYPDATERFYRVNFTQTSFGQENEIEKLKIAYKKALRWQQHLKASINDDSESNDIILFGLSRGASNVLIFAGNHELPNTKAIILESPYYSMDDVIKHIMNKYKVDWLDHSYGQFVAENIFWKYSRHGVKPCDCLLSISKDIAMLIVCSKEDDLVPMSTTIKIYNELKKNNYEKVHIFIADHGKHAKILHDADGLKYHNLVHAFYKKYNLPHDPSSAKNGKSLLKKSQPIFG